MDELEKFQKLAVELNINSADAVQAFSAYFNYMLIRTIAESATIIVALVGSIFTAGLMVYKTTKMCINKSIEYRKIK